MEQLFTDFPAADAGAWKARLEKDLKGITFDQLSVKDRNDITVHPFYTAEDQLGGLPPLPGKADWDICTHLIVTDAAEANRRALLELNNGATALCFIIQQDTDPEILLRGIELPYIYTQFRLNTRTIGFADKLLSYLTAQPETGTEPNCSILYDYIGDYIRKGSTETALATEAGHMLQLLAATGEAGIDAVCYLNAGANSSYELACALAQINEYLNILQEKGNTEDLHKINITLAADTSFFEQIAKLRAFRHVYTLLTGQYGIAPKLHLHVETGNTYRSPFDSYSNLLRDTIAGMAGVIGGADSLYIHPFDETRPLDGDFSRRMSRNQQLIFKEESYLNKVSDAAAGSYYIEVLTDQIAAAAWEHFKTIEKNGGLLAAFDKGLIGQTIKEQAAALVHEYRSGKRVLIGVNKFTNPKDEPQRQKTAADKGKGLAPLNLAEAIL
jgi:methylmalonyl-CoA mutase